MRAAVIRDSTLTVREHPNPDTQSGRALVRVRAALLTRDDLTAPTDDDTDNGKAVRIPGRRFVGVVEGSGPLKGVRVVGDPDIADPDSPLAPMGLAHLDPGRAVLGASGAPGCAAELVAIPERNLREVPEAVDDAHALLAGALGDAAHLSRVERVEGRTYVTVMGSGLDALLAAQVMGRANASVRLLTTNPHRLELCTKWGVRHRHLDQAGRRADQDIVIVTGDGDGTIRDALAMTRPRGAVIVHGRAAIDDTLDATALSMIRDRELRLLGSCSGSVRDGLAALTSGTLDPSGLITARTTLDDLPGAAQALSDPAQIALMVTIGA